MINVLLGKGAISSKCSVKDYNVKSAQFKEKQRKKGQKRLKQETGQK